MASRAEQFGWSNTWWADRFEWRIRQYNHQGGACCWCGEPMEFTLPCFAMPGKNGEAASVEHLVPKRRGASHWDLSNMVLAHVRCNHKRGGAIGGKPLFTPCETVWIDPKRKSHVAARSAAPFDGEGGQS